MWTLAGPFMGNYFTVKSSQLLFRAAIGASDGNPKEQRAAERFEQLPINQRSSIETAYQRLQAQADKGFVAKSKDAVRSLFFGMPSFTQAWVLFTFVVCLMLLLRIEGATNAVWVLPLVALAYGVDNRITGLERGSASDIALFPSEKYIESRYLDEPLYGTFSEQNEQLTIGWQRYLVTEWVNETYSTDPTMLADQIERGEQAFHIARLELRIQSHEEPSNSSNTKKPIPLLVTYVLGNLGFAFFVRRRTA